LDAADSSKTLLPLYQSTRRHMKKDCHLKAHLYSRRAQILQVWKQAICTESKNVSMGLSLVLLKVTRFSE